MSTLRDNPVLAARAFKSRIDNIVQYIWQGKSKPLGEIIDFWIRIEFQNRGSLHAHVILWCLLYYLKSELNGTELTKLMRGDITFIDDPNSKYSDDLKSVVKEMINAGETETPLYCQECGTDFPTVPKTHDLFSSFNVDAGMEDNKELLRRCRNLVADIVSNYAKAILPDSNNINDEENNAIPCDSDLHGSLEDFDYEDITDEELIESLRNIILSVQQHDVNHRKSCFKKGHFCRFYFPRILLDKTVIKFVKLKGSLTAYCNILM